MAAQEEGRAPAAPKGSALAFAPPPLALKAASDMDPDLERTTSSNVFHRKIGGFSNHSRTMGRFPIGADVVVRVRFPPLLFAI